MTEKETLTAYLYRGENKIDEISLVDEDGDGNIAGSFILNEEELSQIEQVTSANENASILYRIDLKGVVGLNVERAFDSYVVKINKMISVFESVDTECRCGVDGNFYFTMNYTDNGGQFSDFVAYIEDNFGNRSECVFAIDNEGGYHNEQKIYVLGLSGSTGKLTIEYKINGSEETTYAFNNDDGTHYLEVHF